MDMIFHDRYELLALRGGDREIALPGREISSGRDVLVHLLSDGYTPENRELLANIDKLPAEYQRRVLDIGDHEGIPYVVTDVLPPNLKLREATPVWLSWRRYQRRWPECGRSSIRDERAHLRNRYPICKLWRLDRPSWPIQRVPC